MKKIMILFITVICCMNVTNLMAQKKKSFNGTVKFSIKYEGDIDPQKLAKAPIEATYLISGNNTKISHDLGGAFQHIITVGDSGKTIVLFDIPAQKMAIVVSKEEQKEKLDAIKFNIVANEESKEFCGFVCKRYDITITNVEEDTEQKMTVYTTEEIGLDERINFDTPGLKGYPLCQIVESQGVKTIYEAVEVKKKKVSPAEYMIPEGYQILTVEEFQQLMQGGGEE